MAIKTIAKNTTGALPVIATLRKGQAKDKGKIGRELEYFRLDWHGDNPNFLARPHKLDECQQVFIDMYGDKPTFIPNVTFLQNSIDDVFPHHFEQWSNKSNPPRCTTRCDGQTRSVWMESGQITRGQSACICNPEDRKCSARGQLFFMLPEFSMQTSIGGLFRLTTTSIVDISNIAGALSVVGDLYGKMFHLYRQPMVINNIVHHMVKLAIADGETQRMSQQLLEASNSEPLQLSSGEPEPETFAPERVVNLRSQLFVRIENKRRYYWLMTDEGEKVYTSNASLFDNVLPNVEGLDAETMYEGNDMPEVPLQGVIVDNELVSIEFAKVDF